MIGPTLCALCGEDHYFNAPPPMWGPCACGGSHYVCQNCVGFLVVQRLKDVCPKAPELHVALALMDKD